MMSFKRKRDEFEDSDDDEPSLGRQILPVANLPDNFNGEPEDGMQYLFTVRRDARNLPHVTRAANPYEEPQPPLNLKADSRTLPEHISLPSEEWRSLFETRFKNFRKNACQPTIGVTMMPVEELRRLLPDKKERELWWYFLAGRPESDWNPPKKPKQSAAMRRLSNLHPPPEPDVRELKWQESWQANDEGEVSLVLRLDSTDSQTSHITSSPLPETGNRDSVMVVAQDTIMYKPREPLPQLLRYIDEPVLKRSLQKMAFHLLMYFTHWINVHVQHPGTFTQPLETHARWIFALLTKVDDYVSADDMNLLRTLARACIALLKQLLLPRGETEKLGDNGGYMSVRSCWLILCAIAGVWAQRDLWMDAEDMLRTLCEAEGRKTNPLHFLPFNHHLVGQNVLLRPPPSLLRRLCLGLQRHPALHLSTVDRVGPPDGGQYEQVLVAQVNKDEGGGSISVYPPSGGWPQGSDFRINFVPDVNHPDQILAQSGQYNIGDASSSALSNLPHTTVTSPVASVSTGSVTSSPTTITVSTTAVTNTVSTTSLRAASATLTSTTAEVTPTSLNAGSKAAIHVGLIPFLLALPFFA
ncbi:hypothetical protein H0H93_000058 [Arthromyces matolae]|nr:hypothetical protein H0H93_000058 [Arthromyces matolae]